MTGEDVVAEAREWVGTPFHWQASLKKIGCDCKGLVVGIARELKLPEGQGEFAKLASDYGDRVPVALLKKGLRATLEPVAGEPEPGDVFLLNAAGKPQHLAIFTGADIIHAWARGEVKAVLSHPWNDATKRRWPFDSAYRFGSLHHD